MWSRLADQLSFVMRDFSRDDAAPVDPTTGVKPPWKFTAIIDWVLDQAGFPDDMRDIPDLPQRAFFSAGDAQEYLMQPTVNLLEYVNTIARDYLGAFICWDPNAGTRGMVRLILPPNTGPYHTLWSFQTTGPAGAGKVVSHPSSYPPRTTFIDRFTSYTKAPEANFIIVTASGVLSFPGQTTTPMYTQFAWNPKSFNLPGLNTADPTHPDYLGRMVPLVYFDRSIASSHDEDKNWAAVNLITRRLYHRAAHAEKWVEFNSPHMPLFLDTNDDKLQLSTTKKRTLRIYDAIKVDGIDCLMRGPRLDWDAQSGGDDFQNISLEAVVASQ
jgi:hypothetical protein